MKTTLVSAALVAFATAHMTSYETEHTYEQAPPPVADSHGTGMATLVATASTVYPTASAPASCTYNFATATDCTALDAKCHASSQSATCAAKAAACAVCSTDYNTCRAPQNGVSANQSLCSAKLAGCVGKAYPEFQCPPSPVTPVVPTTPTTAPTYAPSGVTPGPSRPSNTTVPVAGAATHGFSLLGLAAGLAVALL